MICRLFGAISLLVVVLIVFLSAVAVAQQQKILYVDSYHEAYPWSAGITRGVQSVLAERQEIELKILRMDTKRNTAEDFKQSAALKVKEFIDSWQPDLVIASDDNASKYLIVPYYKDGQLPFVFCGVNWDASGYGFPTSNVTGMVEVQLIDQILTALQKYASGSRVAFLKGENLTARKEAAAIEKQLDIQLDKRFVTTFSAWKQQYLALQQEADMLIFGNTASVRDWDSETALAFIRETTRIPSGNWDAWMATYCLITFANKAEEQGEWAAATALKILAGTPPADIPVVSNKKGKIYLNMELAKILNIKFPIELIERATFTSELGL